MAKKQTKAQKIDWLETKTNDLVSQRQMFRDAAADFEEAHAASGLAKKKMDNEQARLNAIVNDIADIKTGNFTPPLPFPEDPQHPSVIGAQPASTGEDVGGTKPLTILTAKSLKAECASHHRDGVGLSDAQVETLSKAIDGEKTIAGLEKLQRTNPVWTRSIKGFGEAAITKLQDAHEVVRRAFPIPSPDDKTKPPTPAQSSANAAAASNGKPADQAQAKETIADKLNKLEPATKA